MRRWRPTTTGTRPMTDAPTKTCPVCHRTLSVDVVHFYRQTGGDGYTRRCRNCIKAKRRELKAAERERRALKPHCLDCAPARGRRKAAAAEREAVKLKAAAEREAAEREARKTPGASTPDGRRRLIRRRVDLAPPGGKAEAADRARRLMRAADEALPGLTGPPTIRLELLDELSDDDAAQVWPP